MQGIAKSFKNGRFTTTSWPLVASAANTDGDGPPAALQELLLQYLPALKEFLIVRFRFDDDTANDLLQSFVLEKIVKKQIVSQARKERGKFRTFLLNSILNFTIGEIRKTEAKKRIPPHLLIGLYEGSNGDSSRTFDSGTTQQFDLAFTRQVLAETFSRMRQHCTKIKRLDIWELFDTRILKPALNGDEPLSYDQLIARFGFRSPEHASNILVAAKRMFTRFLKSVVREYSTNGNDAEVELANLKLLLNKL